MSENQREHVDIVTPRFDNTFFPTCATRVLTLAQIFLELRHTSYTVDDLPPDVRSEYEAALPYLEKRFKRG